METKPARQHAVVMGGSMAGLLAARVLSDFFERVTIVERDSFGFAPETRKGVPQGRHAHALLARGEEILARFFPGLTASLTEGGAVTSDIAASTRWFQHGGYKRQHATLGQLAYTQSRPYLEWHVRRRVLALPNVTVKTRTSVIGLLRNEDTVRGFTVQSDGESCSMEADLVVDCSGRGSATPRWLPEMGFPAPPESAVHVNLGYATRTYGRPAELPPDAHLVIVYPKPPLEKRGATLLPVEGDRWICTLAGWLGDHPPIDPAGFLEFARSLPAPDIYNVISKAEPLSDPVPHRFPANLRRHYERLTRFPAGYLVLGDAICSFNPVYGQGMTSAALQSEILADALRQPGTNLARTYFRRIAKVLDVPWKLAAGEDFRYPEVRGPKAAGTDLLNRYGSLVHRASTKDARVYGDFLKVLNLIAPPETLFSPANLYRVLRAAL